MLCDCKVCEYGREVEKHLEKIPETERSFFQALYDNLACTEMDSDYYQAIVHNQWPSGDEILKRYRPEKKDD